jgi:hypothetical protein
MKIFLTALMMLLVMSHPAAAQLGGPGWSPGMAVATDFIGEFEQDAVIDANGIVQVTAERKSQVLPVLEGHGIDTRPPRRTSPSPCRLVERL